MDKFFTTAILVYVFVRTLTNPYFLKLRKRKAKINHIKKCFDLGETHDSSTR